MEKAPVTISVDSDTLEKAENLFKDLGLDLSTACNIFLHQAVYECGIPFLITRDVPNIVRLTEGH